MSRIHIIATQHTISFILIYISMSLKINLKSGQVNFESCHMNNAMTLKKTHNTVRLITTDQMGLFDMT